MLFGEIAPIRAPPWLLSEGGFGEIRALLEESRASPFTLLQGIPQGRRLSTATGFAPTLYCGITMSHIGLRWQLGYSATTGLL